MAFEYMKMKPLKDVLASKDLGTEKEREIFIKKSHEYPKREGIPKKLIHLLQQKRPAPLGNKFCCETDDGFMLEQMKALTQQQFPCNTVSR